MTLITKGMGAIAKHLLKKSKKFPGAGADALESALKKKFHTIKPTTTTAITIPIDEFSMVYSPFNSLSSKFCNAL